MFGTITMIEIIIWEFQICSDIFNKKKLPLIKITGEKSNKIFRC